MENEQRLGGGCEEWLRRLAMMGRSPVVAPDHIAFALAAAGMAERNARGTLTATDLGRAYLDLRGLSYAPVPRKPRQLLSVPRRRAA
jgi:hypothetical protein